jgi:hypothetical protein
MRGTTGLKALAVVLLVFVPAAVSATIFSSDEKTTVDLIGLDAKGDFTIFLEKTQTGTSDIAFVLGVSVASNFDHPVCITQPPELARLEPDEVQDFCERDLWVAILAPGGRLFFLQRLEGPSLSIQDVGSLDNLPFLPGVQPYARLRGLASQPIDFPESPYPPALNLFFISQAVVNSLPAGQYSFFAGFTTRVTRATDLSDLFTKAVSNVAQYDVIIEEFTAACGQTQVAGGNTPDTRLIDLGNIGGTFRFDFNTFDQEDQIIIRYEGNEIFNSRCVGTGTTRSTNVTYHGTSTKVSVQVIPNCFGGLGTAWNYTVHCPTTGAFNFE